ncbi:hypothetical protein BD770DRAFT_384478 [Pilaira anomala]|nr:hypothetical protein BD770DRAFT_384478 [Pilaira anomala]
MLTSQELERRSHETESVTLRMDIEDEDGNKIEYKQMELKGESESDKDLIIYSLNESLQIHKEIVERIQNEKDDIEDQFEQEKNLLKKGCVEIEEKRDESNKQVTKLESVYKNLLNELETKELEYRRMETRFYSHVKSSTEQESIYPIMNQMISQINNLCTTLLYKHMKQDITIDLISLAWPKQTSNETIDIIQNHFIDNLDDKHIISLLTERLIMDIIIHDILNTSIHPGVTLNQSFGTIYDWIDKRNSSWASRLKKQITNFIVNQSNEQSDEIESKRIQIIQSLSISLNYLYHDIDQFHSDLTNIVQIALDLNLSIKDQQDTVQILSLQQGSQFNESIMNSVNQGTELVLVITPPFVAEGLHSFIIPAKVYCA